MIIPAILEKDFEEVKKKIKLVEDVAEKIQIDIIDNTIVEGKTFTDIYKLNEIESKAEFDIHLMVKNPLSYLQKSGMFYASMKSKIGCVSTITTQLILDKSLINMIEDFSNLKEELLKQSPNNLNLDGNNQKETIINNLNADIGVLMDKNNRIIQRFIDEAKSVGYKIGLSIDPAHDISLMEPFLNYIDIIQFMGVVPGKQGGELIPSVLDKIKKFKNTFPSVMTQIDGGVNDYNLHDILKTGVDNVVVGSAIFNTSNPKEEFLELEEVFSQKRNPTGGTVI